MDRANLILGAALQRPLTLDEVQYLYERIFNEPLPIEESVITITQTGYGGTVEAQGIPRTTSYKRQSTVSYGVATTDGAYLFPDSNK